jgi:hypothetical protein
MNLIPMKWICIVFFLMVFGTTTYAQDTTDVDKPTVDSLQVTPTDTNTVDSSKVEEVKSQQKFTLVSKAKYEGGDSAFVRKVRENIAYPAEARQKKFQAKLMVQFVVRKDASVGDIVIKEGFPEDADEEFKKLIEGLVINAVGVASQTGWIPATNNENQKVAMRKTLPIVFSPYKTKSD